MKILKRDLLIISMFLLLICCLGAASATDMDSADDISDQIAIDEVADVVDVEIDDSVNSIDDVEIDEEVSADAADTDKIATITDSDYNAYFDEDGYLNDTSISGLKFDGNFNAKSFGNFKIDRTISLDVGEATFNGVSFDLLSEGLILDGATFINDARSPSDAYIFVNAANTIVQNLNVVLTAGNNVDYYGISVLNAANVQILNNKINYTCSHDNAANYNYVIRAMNCTNLTVAQNNITAYLPLKTVSWSLEGIAADYVAGAGIEKCNDLNFTKNNLTIYGNARVGDYPTLDAFMIVDSNNSYVGDNRIEERDMISNASQHSYIYGIDVYQCNNITINNNTVNMNGNESNTTIPGGNATGAAYCIQLTGNHSGVTVSHNNLTTKNGGPNLGIYSQNYNGYSHITVTNNTINVTGVAGNNPWAVVSGMELQDTNATVYDNNITVTNLGWPIKYCQAYGISYCQQTSGPHYFDIRRNHVTVNNGPTAVYLMSGSTGNVINNWLTATQGNFSGNQAVYAPSTVINQFNHPNP